MRDHMDEQTSRLVERFDLAAELAEFVRRRAAEMAGAGKTPFRFRGSCRHCGRQEAHVPHGTSAYDTVRYGTLVTYCPGVSGDGLEVVVERQTSGSAEWPASLAGYWLAAPANEENHDNA
jgi:hypothetical protein